MRKLIFALAFVTVAATGARAQSVLPDGRDGRDLAEQLYQDKGDREAIMRDLGRSGGMSWGMGGGYVPDTRDQPQPKE